MARYKVKGVNIVKNISTNVDVRRRLMTNNRFTPIQNSNIARAIANTKGAYMGKNSLTPKDRA
jgi:hypothetical protein